jgi:hypothetical protein
MRYVLYIEHDNRPHDVSVHKTLAEDEAELRDFALLLLRDADHPAILEGSDAELVEALAECNEYARIYECRANGSRELTPFKAAEAA